MPASWLLDRMSQWRDQPAIAWRDRVESYGDLLDRVAAWQDRLEREGVKSGQVVALDGDYSPSACALLLALIQRRAVVVPLTETARHNRAEWFDIAEVQAEITIDEHDEPNVVQRQTSPRHELTRGLLQQGRPGLILFTSGSTGKSKAAIHDFAALLEKFRVERHSYRAISFLLLDHIGGINTMFYALSNGGTVVAVESRQPEDVCRAIEQHRVQLLPTSPTFLNLLLISEAYRRFDLSSLTTVTYGTEPMPLSTLNRLHEILPDVRLLQT
jgi:long-chain acyl-CoA synthetase